MQAEESSEAFMISAQREVWSQLGKLQLITLNDVLIAKLVQFHPPLKKELSSFK